MYSSFTSVKAQKPVNKKSDTRKEEEKEYKKIVVDMMKVSNKCEIKEEGCTIVASGLHHKVKRSPGNLLDRNNLIRACSNCNLWVELNPLEAIEKGYSISKFKPEEVKS
jgi:5-methylcytosine-specific restriction endonuclease McrA